MRKIHYSILSALFLFTLSCSEKTHEMIVNAENGHTTFNTSKNRGNTLDKNKHLKDQGIQYVRKGKTLNIVVDNISKNDSIVMDISQKDVNFVGDESNRFLDSLTNYSKIYKNDIDSEKELNQEISNSRKSYEEAIKAFDIVKQADKIQMESKKLSNKIDSINYLLHIKQIQNKVILYEELLNNVRDEVQLNVLLKDIDSLHKSYLDFAKELKNKTPDFLELDFKLDETIDAFKLLTYNNKNSNFRTEKRFFPLEEEITVKISKYDKRKSTSNPTELIDITFIQYQRFKIFSSVGAQCMIFNGKYANIYDNKDSIIVRRNGSNIVPSLGTYLNGTWRLNDCLMGFGLGMGIPLQLTENVDMTPNFNAYYSTYFQNNYGRFGFNVGFGIQKVNVLAPGYAIGNNIGTTNLDVPLRAMWTPTFGFAISYNIGDRR